MTKKMILLFAIWSFHLQGMAVDLPAALNFDGQLLDSTDNPITTATTVVFDIYDPSGNCLLYNETQSITPGADGSFTTKIGPSTGNASSADDGNLSWSVIFQNDGQVRASNSFCPGGYTPAANHGRNLRVTVNGTVLTPDYSLSPVPIATVAETLQGKRVSDFLLSAPTSGTSTVDAHLRIANNQQLQLGSGNPSTNYANIVAPGALAASYVLTLPGDDGTAGQVLQTDGNGVLSWVASGGGGGTVTSVATGSGLTGGPITTTGTLSIATGGITNSHLAAGIDASKLTVGTVPPSAITGITSAQIADGTIATVDIGADQINSTHIANNTIVDADIVSISANKLIGGGCAANQILKWNGSTWTCQSDLMGAVVGTSAGQVISSENIPSCLNNQKLQINNGPVYSWSCIDDSTFFPVGIGAGEAGQISLRELASSGINNVTLRAPDVLAASYILTLPLEDGTSGQVLSTDGNGTLNWVTTGAPSPDSLNFTELADALTLDASTDISVTGANVFSITNSGTLNSFRVNDEAADTTPFVIDTNGNVGVGTTVPAAKMEINNDLGGTNALRVRTSAASTPAVMIDSTTSTAPALDVRIQSITRLFVNNTGVGVGTTAPEAPLHISSFMKLQPQATAPTICNPGNTGALAYSSSVNNICVCNGTNWSRMDGTSCVGW